MVEAQLKKRSAPQESGPAIKKQEQQQIGNMKEQVKDTESIYPTAKDPKFGYRYMSKKEKEEYEKKVEKSKCSMVEAQLKKRSAPQESGPAIKKQEQQQIGNMKEQVKDTESIYPTAKDPKFGYRYMSKKEKEEYEKKVEKSKGFDVGPLPNGGKICGRGIICMVYPKTDKDSDDKMKAKYVPLSESGIARYNEGNEGPEYKFVELIKVNQSYHHGFYKYYITFLAENKLGFQRFQALVRHLIGYRNKHSILFCDREPESESP